MIFRYFPALLLGLSILPASAIDIEISYEYDTNRFFSETSVNGPAARATLEAAAAFYSEILTDSFAPIESDVDKNNNYEINIPNPSGGSSVTIPFLQIPADTIRIYVGSRDLGSTLAFAGTGTPSELYPSASISGDAEFLKTAAYRGQDFGTESEPIAENAPWGGYITFNSSTFGPRGFWNYDHTTSPKFNNDLYSTALHEIGHILGVGLSDSYSSLINDEVYFTGVRTTLINDGKPLELTGDRDHVKNDGNETALHPYAEGDGEQLSAFLADRSISERRELTLLDTAILDDIGWDVNYLTSIKAEPSAEFATSQR